MTDRTIPLICCVFSSLLAAGLIVLSAVGCGAVQNDVWYKQATQERDLERRREPLGSKTTEEPIDATAFVGMPETYSDNVARYIEAVSAAIKATPISRERFYHRSTREFSVDPYPDRVSLIRDRNTIVSVVILPRPEVVRRWTQTTEARNSNWLSEDVASKHRGSVYGRTLVFEPGASSEGPVALPASPCGSGIPSWDLYTQDHDPKYFLDLGKLVVTPAYVSNPRQKNDGPVGSPKDESACLRFGQDDGAKLLGEFVTVPAHLKNQRLRWASIRRGEDVHRFLAYSLLDGNGARRTQRFQESTSGPISPYVRPLACQLHQPKIKQHDELLLPTPIPWPPTERELPDDGYRAHEEWCLDDWFPAQKEACWVVREAKDSKPLQESFLLMPASEKSDLPIFFIALFAETEPKQLLKELASLYQVSPDPVLNSEQTMSQLNTLYGKIRDFQFGK